MASAACCAAGPSIKSEYEPKGTVMSLDGLSVYRTGSGSAAVIYIYDIFGITEQAQQVADKLAEAGFNVAMPDFVRGDYFDNDNFKQEDLLQFPEWAVRHDFAKVVKPDMEVVIDHLKAGGATTFGVLGFCWGGWMSMTSGTTDLYNCSAIVHGVNLSAELAKSVKVPQCILQSGEDPSVDDVKAVLDKTAFGCDCVYQRFDDMHHGFCSARGDWTNELQASRASEAVGIVIDFFNKHLK